MAVSGRIRVDADQWGATLPERWQFGIVDLYQGPAAGLI
jgi:hypothetical protein